MYWQQLYGPRSERTVEEELLMLDADTNSASHFNSMRISELRRMVHDKGLDVDGSR